MLEFRHSTWPLDGLQIPKLNVLAASSLAETNQRGRKSAGAFVEARLGVSTKLS